MAETPDVVFKRECCPNATGISLPAREYLPGDGNHHFDFHSPMRQMRRGPKRLPMRCRRRKLQPGIPNTRSAAPLSDFFRTLFAGTLFRSAPRRPRRIKFNLMVSADCEPTSASPASAINRHVDRVSDPSRNGTIDAKRLVDAAWSTVRQVPRKQRIGETGRCRLKEKTGAAT